MNEKLVKQEKKPSILGAIKAYQKNDKNNDLSKKENKGKKDNKLSVWSSGCTGFFILLNLSASELDNIHQKTNQSYMLLIIR